MMHFRCENPKAGGWKHYGGRGISVCPRWSDFDAFLSDMGPKPTPAHTLDRIDSNGPYSPFHNGLPQCRWVTRSEQNLASAKRKKLSLADAAVLLLHDPKISLLIRKRGSRITHGKGK